MIMNPNFLKHKVKHGFLEFEISERECVYPKYKAQLRRDDNQKIIPEDMPAEELQEVVKQTGVTPVWIECAGEKVTRRFVSDVTVKIDGCSYSVLLADYTGQMLIGCYKGVNTPDAARKLTLWYPIQVGLGMQQGVKASRLIGFADHVTIPAGGALVGVPDKKMISLYGPSLVEVLQRGG